jgi:SAM-dependent methyltransferase
MDVRQEVEFFDRFEAEHGDYDVLSEGGYRRFLTVFSELVAPKAGETGIDLGCGSGAFTRRLAKATGLSMTGMDISPRLVERAKHVSGGERYLVGDITETGLPPASYDIIVYSGVLHHCDERDLRVRMLKEGRRLLKPGGRMFAFDPSWHSPSMWLYRDPASPIHSKLGKTENEVLFKRDELAAEIAEAGFEDVRIRGVAGTTFRYVESFLARMILPLYNLYEILLRFSPLENRWGTFLISFARKGS